MDQLRRETQPPAGTPPSPVPQYWNPDADQYERVQGAHGASRVILYGPNGQPISSANRLPVEASVTGEVSIFDSQGNPISTNNRLPVDVGGQIHADVDLGDVTVDLGVVKQGGKDASAEPWEVQLTGSELHVLRYGRGSAFSDWRYQGDNLSGTSGSVIPLDIRSCSSVIILLRNNRDIAVECGFLVTSTVDAIPYAAFEALSEDWPTVLYAEKLPDLPAGAERVITDADYPLLAMRGVGLLVGYRRGGTGTVDVIVAGGGL